MQFLMGLNDSYSAIRGQILMMNPFPNIVKAYASVVQENKQRSLGSIREVADNSVMDVCKKESVAMATRHGQGAPSHFISANRTPLYCSYRDCNHHV